MGSVSQGRRSRSDPALCRPKMSLKPICASHLSLITMVNFVFPRFMYKIDLGVVSGSVRRHGFEQLSERLQTPCRGIETALSRRQMLANVSDPIATSFEPRDLLFSRAVTSADP